MLYLYKRKKEQHLLSMRQNTQSFRLCKSYRTRTRAKSLKVSRKPIHFFYIFRSSQIKLLFESFHCWTSVYTLSGYHYSIDHRTERVYRNVTTQQVNLYFLNCKQECKVYICGWSYKMFFVGWWDGCNACYMTFMENSEYKNFIETLWRQIACVDC